MKTSQVACILPVKDMARARRFYEDRLQLEPIGQRPDGNFLYRCAGTHIALIPKPEGTKAEHTAVGVEVADIVAAIRELQSRGVTFADYDLPGLKTVTLETAVERAAVCVRRAGWLGATTTQGHPLLGGATTPDGPPRVQCRA